MIAELTLWTHALAALLFAPGTGHAQDPGIHPGGLALKSGLRKAAGGGFGQACRPCVIVGGPRHPAGHVGRAERKAHAGADQGGACQRMPIGARLGSN